MLGIDPGIARTGYGIIEKESSGLKVREYGTIKTDPGPSFQARIKELCGELKKVIRKHRPEIAAIEKVFFNKNIKTAIITGQVIGAVILTCADLSVEIVEFTPLQIKQSIVGYGRAEKAQMQKMTQLLLGLEEMPKSDDAADALAVAVTYINLQKYREFVK